MCCAARRLCPSCELVVVGMCGPYNLSQADLCGIPYGLIAFARVPFVQ